MHESYGRSLARISWIRDNFSENFIKELSQDVEEVSLILAIFDRFNILKGNQYSQIPQAAMMMIFYILLLMVKLTYLQMYWFIQERLFGYYITQYIQQVQ